MTIPEMRPFTDEDAREIKRFPLTEPYEPFIPQGPAGTFTINGEIMACVGYELETNYAWMILSPDCVKYPRVVWAIREMLNTATEMMRRLFIAVRPDWPEAVRFATWLGFTEQAYSFEKNEHTYVIFMRVT